MKKPVACCATGFKIFFAAEAAAFVSPDEKIPRSSARAEQLEVRL